MNTTESKAIAAYVADAFPRAGMTAGSVAVLADQLVDLDYTEVSRVVRPLVGRSEFPPTSRAIRDAPVTARLRLPSVATAVHEIAVARAAGRVEDARWSHALIREAVLEVGATRIHEEWSFAHREVASAYERLRQAVLDGASMASMTGAAPELPARLAAVASGIDPLEPPPPPVLGDGERAGPWGFDEQRGEWRSLIEGPKGHRLATAPPNYGNGTAALPSGNAPRTLPARGVA